MSQNESGHGWSDAISMLLAVSCVSELVGVDKSQIIGRSRSRKIADARLLAYAVLADAGHTRENIGAFLGGRDHSSVTTGITRFRDRCKLYPEMRRDYENASELYRRRALLGSTIFHLGGDGSPVPIDMIFITVNNGVAYNSENRKANG